MENNQIIKRVKVMSKGEATPVYHSSASETLESKICDAIGKMNCREDNLKSELRYIKQNKKFMTKALSQLLRLQKQLANRGIV